MEQIYFNALDLVLKRIKQCAELSRISLDHESISHWNRELFKASQLKKKIEKRLKSKHSLILVDFKTKKRVA